MSRFLCAALAVAAVWAAGCKPKYPACKQDGDCRPEEVCVSSRCQQCRDARNCGMGHECKGGRCVRTPGFCTAESDCPADKPLCVANRCTPCKADGECGEGGRCRGGKCIRKGQCENDDDCAAYEDCVAGTCVAAQRDAGTTVAAPICSLTTIYFPFNESAITREGASTLRQNADCLKRAARGVVLEGHADPRGTEEYNLALSERRALGVRKYLQDLGVAGDSMRTLPKGKIEATGSDESGWSRDRRVEFRWQ